MWVGGYDYGCVVSCVSCVDLLFCWIACDFDTCKSWLNYYYKNCKQVDRFIQIVRHFIPLFPIEWWGVVVCALHQRRGL